MLAAVMSAGEIPARFAVLAVSSARAHRMQAESSRACPYMAYSILEITSAPNWAWGFMQLVLLSKAPVTPSIR